jgi:aryl sulfotransferase
VTIAELPVRTRVYQSHHLDSTRWDGYQPRDGDVIISTSIKAGTTWMQRILSLLVFGTGELPMGLWQISPWIDSRFGPIEPILELIEGQQHQRFLKSHLPIDALPYFEHVRYIVVGRDTRDVYMSLWNHYRSYTDFVYDLLAADDPVGGPMPRCGDDLREFWRNAMTRASFEWEPDGWPFWSHHYHANSFWSFRHLPNILLVHYNDLKADLEGEMRRVAAYVGIQVPDAAWPDLVRAASFEAMKADADRILPETALAFGATSNFVYKGTNERWRTELGAEDLALYENGAVTQLDPALRRWLEGGGPPG